MEILLKIVVAISAALAAPIASLVGRQNGTLCLPYKLMLINITMVECSEVCSIRGRPSEVQNQRLGKF